MPCLAIAKSIIIIILAIIRIEMRLHSLVLPCRHAQRTSPLGARYSFRTQKTKNSESSGYSLIDKAVGDWRIAYIYIGYHTRIEVRLGLLLRSLVLPCASSLGRHARLAHVIRFSHAEN